MKDSLCWGLLWVTAVMLPACSRPGQSAAPKKSSPATVEKVPQETELAVLHLTPKAVERLGITTAKVEFRPVARRRDLGGEITVPPGESVIVAAPVTGTLRPHQSDQVPKPGAEVSAGQVIFELFPMLTPERFTATPNERAQMVNAQASMLSLQINAEGDVQQSQEEVAAARISADRAEQLLKDRVGSERALDDAKAQLAIAESRLQAATQRKAVLDQLSTEIETDSVAAIPITSPTSGMVRTLPVSLGQTVASGTPLFEVVNLDTVWVRVPVYVGRLDELDLDAEATVHEFGRREAAAALTAAPVLAPPTADPLASSADLYYALDNQTRRFRPGERVAVSLSLQGQRESLVVPSKSILRDIHGGTWVYQRVDAGEFRRARVGLKYLDKETAVLESGPAVGTEVVVDGAAELFGTEFGTGK